MSTATRKTPARGKLKELQELISSGRVIDRKKLLAAVRKQDEIRKRLSSELPPSDSTAIIRKFRDKR